MNTYMLLVIGVVKLRLLTLFVYLMISGGIITTFGSVGKSFRRRMSVSLA